MLLAFAFCFFFYIYLLAIPFIFHVWEKYPSLHYILSPCMWLSLWFSHKQLVFSLSQVHEANSSITREKEGRKMKGQEMAVMAPKEIFVGKGAQQQIKC